MIFRVTDNYGKAHFVEYEWDKEDGIPNAEDILDRMEKCTCSLNEFVSCCEGDCISFDNGVVELVTQRRVG